MKWTLDDGLQTTNYKTRTAECQLGSIKRRQGGGLTSATQISVRAPIIGCSDWCPCPGTNSICSLNC